MASVKQSIIEWGENPYIGPRTFKRSEKRKFFGRDREARNLVAKVISHRMVLFYAQSGSGKSSLINAKLIPSLSDEEGFEVLPVGRVSGHNGSDIETNNIFVYNLLSSLHQKTEKLPDFSSISLSGFLDNLIYEDGNFFYDAQFKYTDSIELKPRVLLIDQFEEILTTNTPFWKAREDFFQQLGEALALDDQLWVILAMREDFIAGLDPYQHYLPDGLQNHFYMQQLGRKEALSAIKNPAEGAKRPFAENAAETLVDNLRELQQGSRGNDKFLGEYIEPVQLQAVCYQMWEKLKTIPGDQITVQDVDKYADVNTALIHFYEDTIADTIINTGVSEPDLRNWFDSELITEAGTRNMVFRGDEITGNLPTPIADYVKGKFILREDVRPGGIWYELVHDRFVAPILKANREWQMEQPLIRLAQKWVNADRNNAYLLGARQLAEYTKTDTNWQALGPLILAYVSASQEANQKATQQHKKAHEAALANEQHKRIEDAEKAAVRHQKWSRFAWLMVIIALIAAITAGIFAVDAIKATEAAIEAREKANENATVANENATVAIIQATRAAENLEIAEENEINANNAQQEAHALLHQNQGNSVFDEQPQLGLRLLLEGWETAINPETKLLIESNIENKLHTGVTRLADHPAANISTIISNTFTLINYSNEPDELWDREIGEMIYPLSGDVSNVDIIANSSLFIIYYDDDSSTLHNNRTGEITQEIDGDASYINTLASDSFFVIHYDNGSIELRDNETGGVIQAVDDSILDIDYADPIIGTSFFTVTYDDWSIELRDNKTGEVVREVSGNISYIDPLIDNPFFAIFYYDELVELRDGETGEVIQEINGNISHIDPLIDSPFFAVSYYDELVELRDDATGEVIQEINGNISYIYSLADTPFFAVSYREGLVELRDNKTGEVVQEINGNISYIDPLIDSPFFAVSYREGLVELRDNKTGEVVQEINGNISYIDSLVDSPFFMISHNDGLVELRSNKTGEVIREINGDTPYAKSIMDTGFFIIYYPDGSDELWNNQNEELIQILSGNVSHVYSVLGTPYFIVSYEHAPDELRKNETGELVTRNEKPVTNYALFGQDFSYEIYVYQNGQSDLLRDGELVLQLSSNSLPVFFSESNTLAILTDGQIKFIDLNLLEDISGNSLDNPLTGEHLMQFTCNYISVTDSDIKDYLRDEKTAQACQIN